MVIAKMFKNGRTFHLCNLRKRIAVTIVVQIGKMNEATTELINRVRPTVKLICEFNHLSISDPAAQPLRGPLFPRDGSFDKIIAISHVILRKQKNNSNHGIEFLA